MKTNIPKMFRYGNIVNKIYFIASIVFIVLSILLIVIGTINEAISVKNSCNSLLGIGIHQLAATILCKVFVINKAQKEVEEDFYKSLVPFILSIVFGAISGNPFYVIAGIFGVILLSKNNNQPKEEENN